MPRQQNHHENLYLRHRTDLTGYVPCVEDRIAVRRIEWPAMERGLHVPESARPNTGNQLGEVIGIGPGRTYSTNLSTGKIKRFSDGYRDGFSVKIGDRVVYARSPVNEIEDRNGDTVTLLFEEQAIIAILEDGKPRPLYDRLVVKRMEPEQAIGSIAVPQEAQKESTDGVVLAVGGGRKLEDGTVIPLDVAVGDSILFGSWCGTDIRLAGETYTVLREYEIIGVRTMAAS